jgi:UDP-glucose 4-epimerase
MSAGNVFIETIEGDRMAVLVTGGAGYIGSHMALALVDAGETVAVLDNLSTGQKRLIPPQATFYEGDIGDAELLSRILGEQKIDAILHFAGSIVVPESVADPLLYYHNNTVKSRALLAAAVQHGVKHFIFSSTAVVYCPTEPMPLRETGKINPISPYGASKVMTERMLADTGNAHDLTYCVLRYFNVAGADPEGRSGQSNPKATHLIKTACQAVLGLRPGLNVYGTDYDTVDGTCVRDYIHVTDLVRAHIDALNYLRKGGTSRVMNVGYGHGYSVLQVLDTVKKVSGVDFPVEFSGRRPGDPAELVSDPNLVRETLGWRPELDDLSKIVEHALAWERKLAAG